MKKLLTLLLAAFVFTACNDAQNSNEKVSTKEDLKPKVIGSAYM